MSLRATTLDEACRALAAGSFDILAGGTDYYPGLGDGPPPRPVLDLGGIEELAGVEVAADHVRIGAGVTWSGLGRAALPPAFDALKAAGRELGSVQIQNTATLVGNLCNASPAADGVPPLLVLDAMIELASTRGRRRVPLCDFITGSRRTGRGADEIVTAILVPHPADCARSAFLKLGSRRYLVVSIAMVAAVVEAGADGRVAGARVAIGACSAVARRLHGLEDDLVGRDARPGLGTAVRLEHLADLAPIDDFRATAAYRMDAACTLVGRTLDACVGEAA